MHRDETAVPAPEILADLQRTVNLMARLTAMPVGLLNVKVGDEIEIAVSAEHPENPYPAGQRIPLGSPGVYCEKVIRTGRMLVVPDGLKADLWPDEPDFVPGMRAYLGFPIRMPDGEIYGTLCVLDRQARDIDADRIALVEQMRDLAERILALWWLNVSLGDAGRSLADYGREIRELRGLVPICSHCKSIREDSGFWRSVDAYFNEHAGVDFTHSICPACARTLYPELQGDEGAG